MSKHAIGAVQYREYCRIDIGGEHILLEIEELTKFIERLRVIRVDINLYKRNYNVK